MDLLACPIDKKFPLKLMVFDVKDLPPAANVRQCEIFCSFHGDVYVKDFPNTDCKTCYTKEITEAIILCDQCGRWYPVEEEIPRMLPDELRKQSEDLGFLRKWRERIPAEVLKLGKPFNLG